MPTHVSLDFRTRTDADVRPVDPAEFFEHDLAELADRNRELAVPGARELRVRPFTIEVDGASWTLSLVDDRIDIARGATAESLVRLDAESLTDLVHDIRTPMGFFTGGDLDMPRGRLEDFLDWWVVLRSMLDERRAHTAGAIDFRDPAGDPLDLTRTFAPDAPDDEMAHFLGEAGFLHVGGLFSEAEMAAVSADIDAALPSYAPDDGRSWWAHTASGEHRAVRLQYFQEHSETTAAILGDDRYLRIGRLTDDGYVSGEARRGANVIEALVKPIGVVDGISDLPWHKDCSLGRHSYRCCGITVGISVTGADASSGQLRVVAGSHRALIQPAFVRRRLDLPQVDLPTRTGDITVHLSCTLHMSQAPTAQERRVMYTGFGLPDPDGLARHGQEKINRIREGSYKTVSQPPAAVR
jgi:hypothetical protein